MVQEVQNSIDENTSPAEIVQGTTAIFLITARGIDFTDFVGTMFFLSEKWDKRWKDNDTNTRVLPSISPVTPETVVVAENKATYLVSIPKTSTQNLSPSSKIYAGFNVAKGEELYPVCRIEIIIKGGDLVDPPVTP